MVESFQTARELTARYDSYIKLSKRLESSQLELGNLEFRRIRLAKKLTKHQKALYQSANASPDLQRRIRELEAAYAETQSGVSEAREAFTQLAEERADCLSSLKEDRARLAASAARVRGLMKGPAPIREAIRHLLDLACPRDPGQAASATPLLPSAANSAAVAQTSDAGVPAPGPATGDTGKVSRLRIWNTSQDPNPPPAPVNQQAASPLSTEDPPGHKGKRRSSRVASLQGPVAAKRPKRSAAPVSAALVHGESGPSPRPTSIPASPASGKFPRRSRAARSSSKAPTTPALLSVSPHDPRGPSTASPDGEEASGLSGLDSDEATTEDLEELPSPDPFAFDENESKESSEESPPLWIPRRKVMTALELAAAVPWSKAQLEGLRIQDLTGALVIKSLTRPPLWIFPPALAVPKAEDWNAKLVAIRPLNAILSQEPWAILATEMPDIGLPQAGWFAELRKVCKEYLSRHGQSIWESTHHLCISVAAGRESPGLAKYWIDRKNRRKRATEGWAKVCNFVVDGIRRGHCDLDIFLHPIMLHLANRRVEKSGISAEGGTWYPGLGKCQVPTLQASLDALDQQDPWRNQFRQDPDRHPGLRVPRLRNKFC